MAKLENDKKLELRYVVDVSGDHESGWPCSVVRQAGGVQSFILKYKSVSQDFWDESSGLCRCSEERVPMYHCIIDKQTKQG
jgi:hypothetical protein